MKKGKPFLILLPIFLAAFLVLSMWHQTNGPSGSPKSTPPSEPQQTLRDQTPKVVSTNPSPLNNSTITPIQTIEITFNTPLVNVPEIRNSIDPKTDYAITLSDDKKTMKITPTKPLGFNQLFTLKIGRETKFESGKFLDNDLYFSFRTINYTGV